MAAKSRNPPIRVLRGETSLRFIVSTKTKAGFPGRPWLAAISRN
jgi:hypothetical protein